MALAHSFASPLASCCYCPVLPSFFPRLVWLWPNLSPPLAVKIVVVACYGGGGAWVAMVVVLKVSNLTLDPRFICSCPANQGANGWWPPAMWISPCVAGHRGAAVILYISSRSPSLAVDLFLCLLGSGSWLLVQTGAVPPPPPCHPAGPLLSLF